LTSFNTQDHQRHSATMSYTAYISLALDHSLQVIHSMYMPTFNPYPANMENRMSS